MHLSHFNGYRAAVCLALLSSCYAQYSNSSLLQQAQENNAKRTLSIGYIVFPAWEPLDVFGPLEIIYQLSQNYKITLSVIGHAVGPIGAGIPPHIMGSAGMKDTFGYVISPTISATHTFDTAPALDILFVPGGMGNYVLEQNGDTAVEDFIRSRYPALDYLVSICTGTISLAKAGVLEGKKATTNKQSWAAVTAYGSNIDWVPNARWTEDGKIWTSSGVAAGLDATYALFTHIYGDTVVNQIMNLIEYAPHTDPKWDPFAVVHNVPGADTSRSLKDCVAPVGY